MKLTQVPDELPHEFYQETYNIVKYSSDVKEAERGIREYAEKYMLSDNALYTLLVAGYIGLLQNFQAKEEIIKRNAKQK